jgi:hypothetical protein
MSSILKPVSLLMTITIFFFTLPQSSALGAMIGTSDILDAAHVQQTRNQLKQFLGQETVKSQLAARGISARQAAELVDSLNDAEIRRIAAEIDKLPAGRGGFLLSGGAWGIIGIAIIVAFIILLITDLLGYTDMFNIR